MSKLRVSPKHFSPKYLHVEYGEGMPSFFARTKEIQPRFYLFVGIDFTASNGDMTAPHSLHYLGGMNQYDGAIQQVGSILEPYDADRSFPVYGFGGMPNGGAFRNTTTHCFALNFNESNPEV